MNNRGLANFIWSIADLLRGDYKQAEYGKIILPFTVLRRLDCVLENVRHRCQAYTVDNNVEGSSLPLTLV